VWLRKLVLDASGYETRKALHLVLTLKDGAAGTYLWSESLTPGTPLGTLMPMRRRPRVCILDSRSQLSLGWSHAMAKRCDGPARTIGGG